MPPLPRPHEPELILLSPRRATVAAATDVLIVGGGPAGIGAALGAAQAGARVVVAEQYGFLGGSATVAMVAPFMSYHTHHPQSEQTGAVTMFPTDHGEGEPVIAGVVKTFVEQLIAAGGALPPSLETGFVVPIDHECIKTVALDLLDEAGVSFLLHAFASDVVIENGRASVVFETKSGPMIIRASIVVDCTGDGDIAAWAGAPYELGRETDGLVQPMTLYFKMADFDREAFAGYVREHPDQWRGVHGLEELIAQAKAKGELAVSRESILIFGTPHQKDVSVNGTRILRVVGTDTFDLTLAQWEGYHQVRQLASFLRRYVPGFQGAYLAQSAAQVGVRESRRIRGDYQLTVEDIFSAQRFDDVVARSTYPIDIHNPKGPGTMLYHVPPGEAYDIPLRCLLPQGLDRILTAGRCISGTHEAHSSYRIMPVAMALGQAAGVCAALSAQQGGTIRDVPYQDVQAELEKQGANLGR